MTGWWLRLPLRARLGARRGLGATLLLAGAALMAYMMPRWVWLGVAACGLMGIGWIVMTMR